jgi:predicted kinase
MSIKNVIITSGVPGSGKSTWVQNYIKDNNLSDSSLICSADSFRMVDGNYVFNRENEKQGLPHKQCMKMFLDAFYGGKDFDTVFVDNTNTTAMEMAAYYSVASAMGCAIKIITVEANIEECIKRNVHSVPARTIKDMAERIERRKFPEYWKFENIIINN